MMTDEQIEKLAVGTSEDAAKVLAEVPSNVVDIKSAVKTDAELALEAEKAADEQDKQDGIAAMQHSKKLPFTAEAIGSFAKERFAVRAPQFVKNTEIQIRTEAAFGADGVELNTQGASNYHNALRDHITGAGFAVEELDQGTAKSKLKVKLY